MTIQADVIVVGLGAMGAATLYQLAARGQRVIGIDRFAPPHEQGSSHGETRITRLAVGEGASYLPLVRRSHEIWRELERRCGATLMQTTGGLIMGPRDGGPVHHGQDAFVQRTIALAEQGGIRHEVLSPDAVMERFPQFRVRGGAIGYYEPDAGMLFPEACVRAQIDGARRAAWSRRGRGSASCLAVTCPGWPVRSARRCIGSPPSGRPNSRRQDFRSLSGCTEAARRSTFTVSPRPKPMAV
jgi:sarcosine oxidase